MNSSKHLNRVANYSLNLRIEVLAERLERLCDELERRVKDTRPWIAPQPPQAATGAERPSRNCRCGGRRASTGDTLLKPMLDPGFADEQSAALVRGVVLAEFAEVPFSTGGKNDSRGLYRRRDELPPVCQLLGYRAMERLMVDLIAGGRLIIGRDKNWRPVLRSGGREVSEGFFFRADTRWPTCAHGQMAGSLLAELRGV